MAEFAAEASSMHMCTSPAPVAVGARIFHAGERVRASRGGAPSEVGGRAESDAGDGASAGELSHVGRALHAT